MAKDPKDVGAGWNSSKGGQPKAKASAEPSKEPAEEQEPKKKGTTHVADGWNSSKGGQPKEKASEKQKPKNSTTKFHVPFQRSAARHKTALNRIPTPEKTRKEIFAEKLAKDPKDVGAGWNSSKGGQPKPKEYAEPS